MMKRSITEIIEKYITRIATDELHRYSSWDNCFHAFSASKQTEFQVLHLAFYLASWGMYRGSCGLLQKNHLVHEGAVEILFSKTNQQLKCNQSVEVERDDISAIIEVKNQLTKYYSNIYFVKKSTKSNPISPTDTLLSKIMLGSLGCVPDYDRYFIDGLKNMEMKHIGFNEASLNELFDFIDKNRSEIDQAQKLINIKTQRHYPKMKLLDMFFWQIGYDKEL